MTWFPIAKGCVSQLYTFFSECDLLYEIRSNKTESSHFKKGLSTLTSLLAHCIFYRKKAILYHFIFY